MGISPPFHRRGNQGPGSCSTKSKVIEQVLCSSLSSASISSDSMPQIFPHKIPPKGDIEEPSDPQLPQTALAYLEPLSLASRIYTLDCELCDGGAGEAGFAKSYPLSTDPCLAGSGCSAKCPGFPSEPTSGRGTGACFLSLLVVCLSLGPL